MVTGASRGIGKGIALELGERGATVYVTGTSTTTTGKRAASDVDGPPGTIEETAAAVTALGGTGIAVPCDHSSDEQVQQLMRQVEEEQGRLDIYW